MNSNASASAAGFGFQYERALHRIFHSTHTETRFGIETADDVEEQIPLSIGTKAIREQDKLTTGVNHSLQDSSKNVWNTFRNWLNGLAVAKNEFASLEFVLVTNRIVPEGTLVSTLSNASCPNSVTKAIEALRQHAHSMSGSVAEIAAEVTSFSDEDLAFVITRFHVADAMDDETLKEAIYAALQFPDGLDHCHETIYQSLLGQLFAECQASWKKSIPFWTTSKPFFTRKHMLFEKFFEEAWKPLTQEQTDFIQLIDEYEALELPFIEQLKKIKLPQRPIQAELGHYWAAYSERTRLLNSNRILPSNLCEVESELSDRWKANCDAQSIRSGKEPENFGEEDFREIFLQTSTPPTFSLTIGRVKSNFRYLFMGIYHHQANGVDTDYPIHWHQTQECDE
ncbi:hypothetical protein GV819_18540 [Pseudomonas sp. Fl5BN2]|uniref:ABC-three component system protein n=1 Tax=Pseudomonas sp. Fl5BN2 TaxID=2697652 RepID=UPI0013782AE2|nr:ABC-three component system protein [Pseudomonas sp. Fl5BN2]NBF04282.1 hypothetical protein [Pseudomonas sp. Fl5BN2]